MPYKDKSFKIFVECERRKRLRRENPEWAAKEREQRRAQMKRSRERHGTALDEPRKLKMQTDPDYAAKRRASKAATSSRWRKTHRAEKSAEWAQWRAARAQRIPAWADHDKIRAFYRLAAEFSKLYVPHHVDHIVPLNGELVSGLHVENNLQVIPAQDNLRKGAQLLAA